MRLAESGAALRVETDVVVVGPGRDRDKARRGKIGVRRWKRMGWPATLAFFPSPLFSLPSPIYYLRFYALPHEAVEGDDFVRMTKAKPGHPIQHLGRWRF